MTGIEIALIIAFTGMGAMVQGCMGIGVGLIAGPVLVSIDPGFAPGPLLFVAQIVAIRHVIVEREHIDRPALRNALMGLPVGIALGLTVLVMVNEQLLAIIVGSATALAAIALLAGASARQTSTSERIAGGACAFASITAGLPGPPLVVAFSDMKPATLRGTTGALIFAVAVVAAIALVLSGEFGSHEFRLLLLMIPGAVLGLLAARVMRPRLDRPWFRTAVLILAAAGGAALVLRQL